MGALCNSNPELLRAVTLEVSILCSLLCTEWGGMKPLATLRKIFVTILP